MSNKYIYLSSKGSSSDSDFTVNFPDNLIIKPHSQIRAVNIRVNPLDNAVEIDDENDTFYIGLDFWNKINNAQIPLLPVILASGKNAYILDEEGDVTGMDEEQRYIYFNSQVAYQLYQATDAYCLYRGGLTCEISGEAITIKASTMEMYGCPSKSITASGVDEEVLKHWINVEENKYDLLINDKKFYPLNANPVELEFVNDTNDELYGIVLNQTNGKKNYFVGPTMVTGLVGREVDNKFLKYQIEIDFSNFTLSEEDTLAIYDGYCDPRFLGLSSSKSRGWGADEDLNICHNHFIVFSKTNVFIKYNEAQDDGEIISKLITSSTVSNTGNAKYRITREDWETDDSALYSVKIEITDDNGSTFSEVLQIPNGYIRKNTKAIKSLITNNTISEDATDLESLGFLSNFDNSIDGKISFTCAADDNEDEVGFNIDQETPDYGGRVAKNSDLANISRPLVLITNTNNFAEQANELSEYQLQEMKANTKRNDTDVYYSDDQYDLPSKFLPNAKVLGYSDLGIDLTEYENNKYPTYSEGVDAESDVQSNQRDFPLYFLDLPNLPLSNISAGYLQGFKNTFVAPIELASAQGSHKTFTSKLYTDCYNNLTNDYPLNLNSMRVRICDIDNRPSKQLDKYTVVVLEIRENPNI